MVSKGEQRRATLHPWNENRPAAIDIHDRMHHAQGSCLHTEREREKHPAHTRTHAHTHTQKKKKKSGTHTHRHTHTPSLAAYSLLTHAMMTLACCIPYAYISERMIQYKCPRYAGAVWIS